MSHRILSILCTTLLFAGGALAAAKLLENMPLVSKPTDTLGSLGPLNLSNPAFTGAFSHP
jgi:hypothetical protein